MQAPPAPAVVVVADPPHSVEKLLELQREHHERAMMQSAFLETAEYEWKVKKKAQWDAEWKASHP